MVNTCLWTEELLKVIEPVNTKDETISDLEGDFATASDKCNCGEVGFWPGGEGIRS